MIILLNLPVSQYMLISQYQHKGIFIIVSYIYLIVNIFKNYLLSDP